MSSSAAQGAKSLETNPTSAPDQEGAPNRENARPRELELRQSQELAPQAAAQLLADSAQRTGHPMTTPLQLVLIEDDPNDGEIIARQLRKAGLDCVIHRVQTGPGLLTVLSTLKPDLIISDFSLPRFNGLQALEIAAAQVPDIPFIFVSGTIGEETALQAVRNGATDYVLKSNLARLSAAVERALAEAAVKVQKRQSEQLRRDQELRLQRLTRSYRMLSNTSSAILRSQGRSELLEEVCRIAVELGGYDRVVLSFVDPNARSLRPRACAGTDSKPLRAIDFSTLDPAARPINLAARAILGGAPLIINDLAAESPPTAPQQIWLAHGWPAVAALPLMIDGTAVGAMTLLSDQRGVFDEAEISVLSELIANLCFALQYLEKDEALQFLAYFDSLTGLAKRPLFCQRLATRLSSGSIELEPLTVIAFDIQKLGAINDSLGRYVGDRLIEAIAARLKQTYPNVECAAYFGGGTFALAMPTVASRDAEDSGRLMQNAAAQLFAEPFEIAGHQLRPAIRCGVAFCPQDGTTADTLVQHAEAALKAAREDNDKYMIYALTRDRATSRTVALEARLTAALERHEYLLHYQPKIDIPSGRLVGLEALLRWQDSELGLVPPSLFIPLLERSGAIVEVGQFVLEQAVRDIQSWIAQDTAPVRVAVNVSPLQLRRRDFVSTVLSSLKPLAGQPAGLDIEITESMLMQDIEISIRKLSELKSAGIGIAIDDFGSGYSSLRLLSRLPVDTLKIDRSFIMGVADTPHLTTLVETIISLGHAFDMQTVAEGVESEPQLQMLRFLQCDQAQGFYLGRPAPAADIADMMARLGRPIAAAPPEQMHLPYAPRALS
ncbi:MAG TPA: EAL domain-containing protein [Steroidobacteraceae bacterium]|nr:EAL domain-containing protein [Steroidobacteraceae bacterium]